MISVLLPTGRGAMTQCASREEVIQKQFINSIFLYSFFDSSKFLVAAKQQDAGMKAGRDLLKQE